MVFTIVEGGSTVLQGKQLSFCKLEEVIKCIKESVSNARKESYFSNIWQASQNILTVNDLIEEPSLPRQRKVPKRIDDGAGVPVAIKLSTFIYWIVYLWA